MRIRSPLDKRSRILLDHLRSGDSSREHYVRTALAEMEPEAAVQVLLDLMRGIRHEWSHLPITLVLRIAVSWSGLCVVDWAMGKPLASIWVAAGATSIPALMAVSTYRYSRNKVFKFLARYDDKRVVDVLIDAMRSGDTRTQRAAEPTLLRLLAAFTPADWHLLSHGSRAFLNRRLLESDNAPLVRAILAAWEQVGGHDSIPFVERLSHGEGVLGGDFSIRHAAAEALPAVRESANRAAISETLLRAADPNESCPTLLRPASSNETSDQVLLRPSSD